MPNMDPMEDKEREDEDPNTPSQNIPPLDEEEKEYEEQEDGSVIINFSSKVKGEDNRTSSHYDNLAEYLDESEMVRIADDLMVRIEADKQAREQRYKMYKEGLQRTGLDGSSPGGADFDGASKVVHPMLTEACIDFSAAALRELLPPDGPVKAKIEGKVDHKKLRIAERQKNCLNWQLMTDVTEFVTETEQLLTQLPMGGSQFMKFWHDEMKGRWTVEFVPIDDVLLPYATTDFYTSQRVTHVQRVTEMTFQDRVADGFYRDLNLSPPSMTPEPTESAQQNDRIEGKDSSSDNVDGLRVIYEVKCWLRLSEDDDLLPYLVSLDDISNRVLSIYRNWDEEDEDQLPLDWMVEWGFLPWRGAYKIGLPHVIGTLSIASTGALRALLDSAHINNFPGGVVLKGTKMTGQTTQGSATQFVEIEGPVGATDIRQIAMSYPYNQPSPVLFQLLGWLDQAGKGVVSTSEEKISEASNQMPVGTALALIEQGAKVFSSIHGRLHRSMKKCLEIICRLNKYHLSTQRQKRQLGELLATREDFANPMGVIPVSDPNVFSDGQRYAQVQMVMQLSADQRVQYNAYELHRWALMVAKIPNMDKLLPEPKLPKELNAAAENMNLMMGQPAMAFPDQDHSAHIETHVRFLMDPTFVGSPEAVLQTIPAGMEHVRQHLGFYYTRVMYELASKAAGIDLSELMKNKKNQENIDRLLAAASAPAHAIIMKQFEPLGPVFQQFMQQLQALQPPQPMDPSIVAAQAAQAETQRKTQRDQADVQISAAREQREAQVGQANLALKQADHQLKVASTQGKQQIDTRKVELDEARFELDRIMGEFDRKLEVQQLGAEMAEPGNQYEGI